jgi:limonene-1,2-epoxide hydrolase
MIDKTVERLRSLLKAYDERTAQARAEHKTVHDEAERRRQRACADQLQNVVRPVLQGFMAELQNAGHDASIQDHTEQEDAYPSVALSFAPRAHGESALTSMLAFRYDPRRGIVVQRDVKAPITKARVVTAHTDRIGTIGVDAVSAEWVETKTLNFIEAVLKTN